MVDGVGQILAAVGEKDRQGSLQMWRVRNLGDFFFIRLNDHQRGTDFRWWPKTAGCNGSHDSHVGE